MIYFKIVFYCICVAIFYSIFLYFVPDIGKTFDGLMAVEWNANYYKILTKLAEMIQNKTNVYIGFLYELWIFIKDYINQRINVFINYFL